MAGEMILHIGYDSVLIELRDGVLQRGGYRVVSVKGNHATQQMARASNAELIVIGSGGHYQERLAIAKWLLKNVPGTRVLAMAASPEEKFPDGVFHFSGDTPRDWLLAVDSVLQSRPKAKEAGA